MSVRVSTKVSQKKAQHALSPSVGVRLARRSASAAPNGGTGLGRKGGALRLPEDEKSLDAREHSLVICVCGHTRTAELGVSALQGRWPHTARSDSSTLLIWITMANWLRSTGWRKSVRRSSA